MGNSKGFIGSLLLWFTFLQGFSQDLQIEGYFLQDSAKLGEKVNYILKVKYPSQVDILFPDSTFRFGSMEYLGKKTFTSYTQDSVTTDSVVYELSNFSLEPVKRYTLPVFEILKYDSILHYPEEAELFLQLTIDEIPDVLTFEETNAYQKIKKEINYPLITLVAGILLLTGLLLFLFLGKNIRQKWSVYQEKKRHKRFIAKWQQDSASFIANPSVDRADELLGLWKGYMEILTGKPFKEWTSTEIISYLEQPELLKDFRNIELIIYANRMTEDARQACENLRIICETIYHKKLKNYHEHE